MDKYEFNIKVEQIKKLVAKGDYETAMKIADTIDWRRVRSTSLLTTISQVYERNEEYQDAKDILLLAFERAPIGKGLLFKLTDLALREGNIQEAEAYYREFCELAGDDPRQNLLRFLILEAKEAPVEQQINTLEKYCQEELDEKWLYHLAELYRQAGREEDCVRICDKIMLLFGLGKYVDKAMELKLQYAPLTKYQMDLVENREKYEEKLRAVEEEYQNGTYRRDDAEEYFDAPDDADEEEDAQLREADGAVSQESADPGAAGEDGAQADAPDRRGRRLEEDVVASLHQARTEEDLAHEMSKLEPYDEEEDSHAGETRVLENIRDIHAAAAGEDGMTVSPAAKAALSAAAETAAADEEASVRQFEEDEETIVEDWDLEPEEKGSHLMIAAVDAQEGLSTALESLKEIHRERGTKNPVAKISGENLRRRGIFAVADRLAGKDLVVERAADLDDLTLEELGQLMERDETGIVVVLIDTPARLEKMRRDYPGLASRFRYLGGEGAVAESQDAREEELKRLQAEREAEAARKRLAEREEEIRRQAARDAEDRRRQAEEEARRQEELARQEEERRQAELARQEEERRQAELARQEEERRQAEFARQEEERRQAELARQEEERRQAEAYRAEEERRRQEEAYQAEEESRRDAYREDGYAPDGYAAEGGSDFEAEAGYGSPDPYLQEESDRDAEQSRREAEYEAARAVRREAEREADEAKRNYESDAAESAGEDGRQDAQDGEGMDVEEFVQYACKYASEIDCSISGKSMLALYERAEMMEEDGVLLTRTAAEDLIEEAADKAEKNSFGDLFTSKYDKDGLLILKENHFFD